MKMRLYNKNTCLVILAFLFSVFYLFGEEDKGESNDIIIDNLNEKIIVNEGVIGKILIIGLKNTSENFLLQVIGLKSGDQWNESVKSKVEDDLLSIKRVVESVIITDEVNEDKVDVKIEVLEKLPFLIVPFFSYTNSSGFKPKIKFMHYNFAGWGKYFDFKLDYLPASQILLDLNYRDESFFLRDNMQFLMRVFLSTSATNYYIPGEPRGGIAPLGVISGGALQNKTWNEDLFFQADFDVNFRYQNPMNYYSFAIGAVIDYYNLIESIDESDYQKTPIHEIDPSVNLSFLIPLNDIGFDFRPSIGYRHDIVSDNRVDKTINRYGYLKSSAEPWTAVGFRIPIIFVLADLYPTIIINYYYDNYYDISKGENINLSYSRMYMDIGYSLDFRKKLKHDDLGLEQSFRIYTKFTQRAFDYDKSKDGELIEYDPFGTLKAQLNMYYDLEWDFYERHEFILKGEIFYYFNDIYVNKVVGLISRVGDTIKEVDSEYIMGKNVGDDFSGWLGFTTNIAYKLPLFEFETPDFLTISIERSLVWLLNWYFYIDFGVALNEESSEYTIDYNLLHLFPALAVGTRVEFSPKFIPAVIFVEIGFDVYKIVKTKALSANLVFTFSIDSQ